MRKLYTIILLSFIGFSSEVNAQIVNVPDANFKAALIANGVHDSAGYITVDTAKAFKKNLIVSGKNISDLSGIEAFTAITYLDCSENLLTSLNIASDTLIDDLYCYSNNLTSLNLSSNTALVDLDCTRNKLTALNLSSNTTLISLGCSYNKLTSLNLSFNTSLRYLYCSHNQLTSLNLSSNTHLIDLGCSVNSLTGLNLSSNSTLTSLNCSYNNLNSLNLKNGHNHYMSGSSFYTIDNPSLICIQVDDTVYSKANWGFIDQWAHFSTNCNYVGINELKSLTDINLYPNPVSSQLTIETNGLKMASVNIYDVLGQLMYNRNVPENKVSIDMNAAPAGIYLVQIMDTDKKMITRKIIKQ